MAATPSRTPCRTLTFARAHDGVPAFLQFLVDGKSLTGIFKRVDTLKGTIATLKAVRPLYLILELVPLPSSR